MVDGCDLCEAEKHTDKMMFLQFVFAVLPLIPSQVLSAEVDVTATFGDILTIRTDCAKDTTSRSVITVTSAQDVILTVTCSNNYIAETKSLDKVHYIQEVAFWENDTEPCKFEKKKKSHVYTVNLYVSVLDKDKGVSISQLRNDFLMTCTYDEKGSAVTSQDEVTFKNTPFQQHLQENGGKINSTLNLTLTYLTGDTVVSPVHLGKLVKLIGVVKGPDFVQAKDCNATNGLLTYSILISGCGDGIIFPKTQGFITKGKVIKSPTFSAFRLRGNPTLVFSCRFAACGSGCDGDSCTHVQSKSSKSNARIKRGTEVVYTIDTDSITVQGSKKEPVMIHVDANKEQSQTSDYYAD